MNPATRTRPIEVLEKVTKENPTRFETFELLGELYQQKGDIDRALQNYKHSILIDSSAPSNHIHVADLQIQLKRFDEAVETAKAAREKFPESPEALYLHAYALSQAKRHTEALAIFAEALADFEAGHEEFLTAQFYFQYGAAAEQAGILDKAARC
jgi:tetratricopeptide (TPR) repeat protein